MALTWHFETVGEPIRVRSEVARGAVFLSLRAAQPNSRHESLRTAIAIAWSPRRRHERAERTTSLIAAEYYRSNEFDLMLHACEQARERDDEADDD